MKKKKQNIIIAVVLIAIGILVFTPFLDIIGLTEPGFCIENPYNEDCICLEDEEKNVWDRAFYVPDIYFCEKSEKVVDLDGINVEENIIAYGKQEMKKLFPDCNTIECNFDNYSYRVSWGYSENGRRVADIDCYKKISEDKGSLWNGITFFADTGEVTSYPWCNSRTITPEEDIEKLPAVILKTGEYQEFYAERVNQLKVYLTYYSDCNKTSSLGNFTYTASSFYDGKIGEWKISDCNLNYPYDCARTNCDIISQEGRDITFECDGKCDGESIEDKIYLYGYYSEEYLDSKPKCYGTNGEFVYDGQTAVCNEDESKYVCNGGVWQLSSAGGWGSANPICPA